MRGVPSRGRRLALTAAALAVSLATVSVAAVVQQENLRVTLLAQVQPYKLPRTKPGPIAVFVAGHVAAVDGGVPDQLQRLSIKVNRHALLRTGGLPRCPGAAVQATSSSHALLACAPALVGSGQFWAHIVLPEQGAYPTQGRLLIFNGRHHGRPAVLVQIYTSHPFSTSFVIPFTMHRIQDGVYGTEFTASLPESLGDWGYVDRIKLTLKRKYVDHGRRLSYFNAACPALPGADRTAFHLAFATFTFSGNRQIGADVTKACGVKE